MMIIEPKLLRNMFNSLSGESVSLDFKEKGARYIKVKLLTSGVPLSLAEVEVLEESDW